jgi:hypothetical protein
MHVVMVGQKKLQVVFRHSGAPRSGEPGIHNPCLCLWIPGSLASLAPLSMPL